VEGGPADASEPAEVSPEMITLWCKHLLIRTRLEQPAMRLRRIFGVWQRWRHPELCEIYAEPERLEEAMRRLIRPSSTPEAFDAARMYPFKAFSCLALHPAGGGV